MEYRSRIRDQASACIVLLTVLAYSIITSGCAEPRKPSDNVRETSTQQAVQTDGMEGGVNETIAADLEVLGRTRVFFGHQSVGSNLLAGLQDIADQVGDTALRIIRDEAMAGPGLYHSLVGQNEMPRLKMDEFAAKIREMAPNVPDVAMLKLCYVDIDATTDVDELFSYYQQVMEGLQSQYPEMTLVHVTAPLTTRAAGRRDKVKRLFRLFGVRTRSETSNPNRIQFSKRLHDEYGSDVVFDLARVESTRPDGSRVTYRLGSETYYMLNPDYSNDGGHLDEVGRIPTAREMLRVIAEVARRRQ